MNSVRKEELETCDLTEKPSHSQKQSPGTKHRRLAAVLSMIPGLGQFYNRQFVKGLIFLLMAGSFFIAFHDLLDIGLWGLVTLGSELPRDHSIFLLIQGIIALVVTLLGLAVYGFNLYDAYQTGKKRDERRSISSVKEQYRNLIDSGFPYMMLTPGFLLLLFVVVFPIIFMVLLSFTNYDLYHSPPAKLVDWTGFQNFIDLVKVDIWRETFLSVFAWTIIWTFAATTGQVVIGILLAIVIQQKEIWGKRVFRTIFILPWAIPAFVSVLIFSGMFNESFGAINQNILHFFGVDAVPWLTEPFWTKIALIFVQWWLGFPFIFVMVTGVIQSIPGELYEAAAMDGASRFSQFKNITLPMILFATAPILITQYTYNFNNFNVIYLFNGGGPAVSGQNAGGTDILISWVYDLTMASAQYGKAAAITMILSIIVIVIALWQFRRTKSFNEEDMM